MSQFDFAGDIWARLSLDVNLASHAYLEIHNYWPWSQQHKSEKCIRTLHFLGIEFMMHKIRVFDTFDTELFVFLVFYSHV